MEQDESISVTETDDHHRAEKTSDIDPTTEDADRDERKTSLDDGTTEKDANRDEGTSTKTAEDVVCEDGTSVTGSTMEDEKDSLKGAPTEDADHDERASRSSTRTEDVDHDERTSSNGTPAEDDETTSGNGTPTDDEDEWSDSSEISPEDINPFKIFKDLTLYKLEQDEECVQERGRQRTLQMHERGAEPRESGRAALVRLQKDIEEEAEKEVPDSFFENLGRPPSKRETLFILGPNSGQTIRCFNEEQREISRLRYAVTVGQEKIQSLEAQLREEEDEIKKAEEQYNDEAFMKYVQEEEKKTMQLIQLAKNETEKLRTMKEEIKRNSKKIHTGKREIAKCKALIEHDQCCQEFLWILSPPEWQKEQETRKEMAEKIKAATSKKRESAPHLLRRRSSAYRLQFPQMSRSQSFSVDNNQTEKMTQGNMENPDILEFYETPQVYFKDHSELLNHLEQMEGSISRYNKQLERLEQTLENHNKAHGDEQQHMKQENDRVNEEINQLTKLIQENNAKAKELEKKISDFCNSDEGPDKLDAILNQLHKKISEVYESCTGNSSLGESSQNMLKKIEECLYVELDKFSQLPEDELNKIKRQYRQESISRSRKQEEQRRIQAQEDLWQQRMEMRKQRSMAEVKKPVGKKVMWRSILMKGSTAAFNRKKKSAKLENEEFEKLLHW